MLRFLSCSALALAIGFGAGWQVQAWRAGAAETKGAVHTVAVTAKQGDISTKAAASEATAQAQIRYVTRTITKEIPTYVTPEDDRRYPLSVGFVRLHDAAVAGVDPASLSDPAGLADDAASDVAPSEAASVIATNYGECRAVAERLTALQQWVLDQAKAFSAP